MDNWKYCIFEVRRREANYPFYDQWILIKSHIKWFIALIDELEIVDVKVEAPEQVIPLLYLLSPFL